MRNPHNMMRNDRALEGGQYIKAQIEKQAKDQSRPEALNEDQSHDASLIGSVEVGTLGAISEHDDE